MGGDRATGTAGHLVDVKTVTSSFHNDIRGVMGYLSKNLETEAKIECAGRLEVTLGSIRMLSEGGIKF